MVNNDQYSTYINIFCYFITEWVRLGRSILLIPDLHYLKFPSSPLCLVMYKTLLSQRWNWGPQFHLFFFSYVLKMNVKIVFLQLPRALFSLHDTSILNTKWPRRDIGLWPQLSLYCPAILETHEGWCLAKQSLSQPSFLPGRSPPLWALSRKYKVCHGLSVRTEAKKAVNASMFSLHCH